MPSNFTTPAEYQLYNPDTPMAFFPASLAREMTISCYVLVGTVTAMIWDVLNNLRADYTMITKHRVQLPTVSYFTSRLSNLAWLLAETIFLTAPLGNNCAKALMVTSCLLAISIPSTSLLFLFRLRAVYRDEPWVMRFFSLLWLGVCGGAMMSIFGTSAGNIGPTEYCTAKNIKSFVSFSGISVAVYDTLVFAAISWRLTKMTLLEEATLNNTIKAAFFCRNVPAFTRSLLKDGQEYYLLTIGFSIMATTVVHSDSIPLVYKTMISSPNIMLMNALACRVYRNTKLGMYTNQELSGIIFRDAQTLPGAQSRRSVEIKLETEQMCSIEEPGLQQKTLESSGSSIV